MTIAIAGPAGYRFQDLACIALTLRFIGREKLTVFVESDEDAKIEFVEAGAKRTINVQVKQSAVDIDLPFLAGVLTHFGARATDDFLLKTIAKNVNAYALLVAGGRCTDGTKFFLRKGRWLGQEHDQNFIPFDDVRKITASLQQYRDNTKTLAEPRAESVADFVSKTNVTAARAALCRVVIEELIDNDKLYAVCYQTLFALYKIPLDQAEIILPQLREAVVHAKENGKDFAPLLQAVLHTHIRSTIAENAYRPRGCEEAWRAFLSENRILLLSGPPKCGKTFAAKYYLSKLHDDLYETRAGDDVGTAERFLTSSVSNSRAFLLEDPFGAVTKVKDARERLGKIRTIMANMAVNRRLIITQRKDILLEMHGHIALDDCSINGLGWFDLDSNDIEFLCDAWKGFCADAAVPVPILEKVATLLRNGENIEIGSLRHLASVAEKIPHDASRVAVLKYARPDADDLAAELGASHAEISLLNTLAFATAQNVPIAVPELKYILNLDDNVEPASYKKRIGMLFSFSDAVPEVPLPEYKSIDEFDPSIQHFIDILELKRYVDCGQEQYNFTHPFYRSVGQASVKPSTQARQKLLFRILRRSIFCLSPRTSYWTVKNLDWIFEEYKSRDEIARPLVALVMEAFDASLFVKTKEFCYRFLLRHLAHLTAEEVSQLPEKSKKLAKISLRDVRWIQSEAWLYWGSEEDIFSFERRYHVHKPVTLFTTPQPKAEDASKFILNVEASDLKESEALFLLSYDESVIRAEVAKIWFSCERETSIPLIVKIFQDDHPNVIINGLGSLLKNYGGIDSPTDEIIVQNLREALESPFVATAVMYRLDLFELDFKQQAKTWSVFARMVPALLKNVPVNQAVNLTKLGAGIQHALDAAIKESEKAGLLEAWIAWLEIRMAQKRPLNDWILGVISDLIAHVPTTNPVRLPIVKRYSILGGTSAKLILIQSLARKWHDLAPEEREILKEQFLPEAQDFTWRAATLMVNADLPVCEELLDSETIDVFDIAKIDAQQGSPTVLALLSLIYRRSPSASHVGIRAQSIERWMPLIKKIASNPSHIYFKQSFKFLREHQVMEFNSILVAAFEASPMRTVECMLEIEAQCQGSWNPTGWETVHALLAATEKHSIYLSIETSLFGIVEGLDEVELCFGEGISEHVLRDSVDLAVLDLLEQAVYLIRNPGDELPATHRAGLATMMLQHRLLPRTYRIIDTVLTKHGASVFDDPDKLNDLQTEADNAGQRLRERCGLNTLLSIEHERAMGWIVS